MQSGQIEFVISTNEELQEESKFLSEEFPIAMYTQNFNFSTRHQTPSHSTGTMSLEITWISDGELEYCISGDKFRLRSDKLLRLLQSHQLHSSLYHHLRCENSVHQLYPGDFPSSDFTEIHPAHAFAVVKASSDYETEKISQNWKQEPLGYFSVMNFLSQVFEEILKEFEENAETPDLEEGRPFTKCLDSFTPILPSRFPGNTLRIRALNKNRCTALFKTHTNMSPIKYVNEYRLYTAKNMIFTRTDPSPISSADVGYNQISHL